MCIPDICHSGSLQVMHIGANVGRITLAARYGPELGEYMVHCHNNVHEDNDMFRAFMVRLTQGLISHLTAFLAISAMRQLSDPFARTALQLPCY